MRIRWGCEGICERARHTARPQRYADLFAPLLRITKGMPDIAPVVTHRFGYSEHAEAFAVAGSGEAGKVLLDWREE